MRFFKRKRAYREINPDEIFLDSHNSPNFNRQKFEGQLERPIKKRAIVLSLVFFVAVSFVFYGRLYALQVVEGEQHFNRSENNSLDRRVLFADRGVIYDRNNTELVWNVNIQENQDFPLREYTDRGGFGVLLGYVNYPSKDDAGFYWSTEYDGVIGIESNYNDSLNGENGSTVIEENAVGKTVSENVIEEPRHGNNVYLTLDAGIQEAMFDSIKKLSFEVNYEGGAGVIMDIYSGELIALTTYPEYDPNILAKGEDSATISGYFSNEFEPMLNRAIAGRYSPGSTVKPFISLAALHEGIITENKIIRSTGDVKIQSPYDPEVFATFRDWKEGGHGWTDVRKAIAESVNTFFYAIGGGYEDQEGLGITRIERYIRMFGIGDETGITISGEKGGVVPNPIWKKETFDGDAWRLGDTYNTSIGQYGFQVTPIQMVRAVAALANDGVLVTPFINKDDNTTIEVIDDENFSEKHLQIVRDGMRQVVTSGTGRLMDVPYIKIAAKTGTAQTGYQNNFVNSWSMGFFPYDDPKYAFVVLMERGPSGVERSASFAVRSTLDWMQENSPQYFGIDEEL
jgi:penicillin-binding protein 2